MTPPAEIWCLLSTANNYDQPANNLVRWWASKPPIEELARFMARPFSRATDDELVFVVDLWRGKEVRCEKTDTDYRLLEVKEGALV